MRVRLFGLGRLDGSVNGTDGWRVGETGKCQRVGLFEVTLPFARRRESVGCCGQGRLVATRRLWIPDQVRNDGRKGRNVGGKGRYDERCPHCLDESRIGRRRQHGQRRGVMSLEIGEIDGDGHDNRGLSIVSVMLEPVSSTGQSLIRNPRMSCRCQRSLTRTSPEREHLLNANISWIPVSAGMTVLTVWIDSR